MTIEVRQLLIKSQVYAAPLPLAQTVLADDERIRLKAEILRECKFWMTQKLQAARER